MAAVMVSSSALIEGDLSSKSRDLSPTIDMLADIEKRIMQHISEQRARENSLESDDSDFCRPRYVVASSRSQSPSTEAFLQMDDIPLDLIFDSPETQVSPSRSPLCELNRRGATFHRIDNATADADDLRSHQWSQMSQDSRIHSQSRCAGLPTERERSISPSGQSRGIRACETLDVEFQQTGLMVNMNGGGTVPIMDSFPAPRKDVRIDVARSVGVAREPSRTIGAAVRLDRRRSRSLSQIKPMKLELQPLTFVPTHLRAKSASPQSPAFGDLTLRSPPSRVLSDRRRSAPVSPRCIVGPPPRSPLIFDDGNTAVGRSLLQNSTEHLDGGIIQQQGHDAALSAESLRMAKGSCEGARSKGSGTPAARLDPRRWLPRKSGIAMMTKQTKPNIRGVGVRNATSGRAMANKKSTKTKKKWAVGESVTDLINAFKPLEVDEIIDTTCLSKTPVSEDFPTSKQETPARKPDCEELPPTASAIDKVMASHLETPVRSSLLDKSLPVLPLTEQHPAFRNRPNVSNPDLRVDCIVAPLRPRSSGQRSNTSVEAQLTTTQPPPPTPQHLPPHPPQPTLASMLDLNLSPSHSPHSSISSVPSPGVLPTIIPSVSTDSSPDLPIIVSPDSLLSPSTRPTPSYRHSSSHLPFPLLHGPIRLETTTKRPSSLSSRRSSQEPLDWTAFQMAISGPTGDYLMGGGISSSSLFNISNEGNEAAESNQATDDDIVAWYDSYGFQNEGLLVLDNEGGEEADTDEYEDWGPPIELPALDSGVTSVRTSGGVAPPDLSGAGCEEKQVDEDEDDPAKEMSCNLNDLGSFLEFEAFGLGAGAYDGTD